MQFHQLSATVSVSPFGRYRAIASGCTPTSNIKTLNWKLRYWHNDADIYDLAGPVAAQPQGRRLHRQLQQDQDLRSAAPARPVRSAPPPISGWSSCPPRRMSPARRISTRPKLGVSYTNTRKSLGGVDHEKGIAWRAGQRRRPCRRRQHSRTSGAGSTMACRCRWPNSSAWGYAQAGHRRRPVGQPARRASISAASATTMSITARRSATASWRAFRASRSTRSPPASFAKLTGEVNLPPLRFAEVGTAGILPELRPPGAVRRGDAARAPRRTEATGCINVGAQVDFGFTVVMRLPMVFSVGVGAGFRRQGD